MSMLHPVCVGLQRMWEDMGVKWEWTWYSQTVHAFTQPQLVGPAASAVSVNALPAALRCPVHC